MRRLLPKHMVAREVPLVSGRHNTMSDYVRVMISIAAQWRVAQALGPAALALAGVPVTQPALPKRRPAGNRKSRTARNGKVQPKNGHKGWK